MVRIHGSARQASEVAFLSITSNNLLGMEVRVLFLTVIPNNPFTELLLPVLGVLSSAGLKILVPVQELSDRNQRNNGPIELADEAATWLF